MPMSARSSRRSLVVALADLGRSPRMQRHALALAQASPDIEVEIVGYEGSPVQQPITAESRVRCRRIPARPEDASAAWNPLTFVHWASRSLHIGRAVFGGARPNVILVQNPANGSARTLSWVASRVRGARLVIDWHDRAGAEQHGRDRTRAIRAITRRERRWAQHGDAHLASSRAMAEWLRREYKVHAEVLYDRPAAWFSRPDLAAAGSLWQRLARDLSLGSRRIPIAVCPTGWTPNEDFDLLLESLERAERRLTTRTPGRDASATPELAVLLTGRGPLRSSIEARLGRRSFSRIAVRTTWLEPADYLVLVGMADVGICLHQSATGLDLPGKLAEFRGVGVPALAFDYAPVLNEVLETGKQGLTFRDPSELAAVLVALATDDVESVAALSASRAWLTAHPAERWEEHWQAVAAPLLNAP